MCMLPLLRRFGRLGRRARRQRVGLEQLQAARRLVAVDLLHIELAHEVDRLRASSPGPGTMIGKPGG